MEQLKEIITLLSTFITVAGGLWMGWGMVSTGFSINSHDGNGIRNGILQIVGAGVVLAGGLYMKSLGS